MQVRRSALTRSRATTPFASALAVAAALTTGDARASDNDNPAVCTAAERPVGEECVGLPKLPQTLSDDMNPNHTVHFISDLSVMTPLDGHTLPGSPIAVGLGMLLGFAPTSFATSGFLGNHPQFLRLSAGLTTSLANWTGGDNAWLTFEPRARVSLGDLDLTMLRADVYLEAVGAFFPTAENGDGKAAAGGGGGLSFRVMNRLPVEIGYDVLAGHSVFARLTGPGNLGGQLTASIGFDFVSAFSVSARQPPQQEQIDLRCSVLSAANRISASQPAHPYCAAVREALTLHASADLSKTAMENFLAYLKGRTDLGSVLNEVVAQDDRANACVAKQRRLQRVCADCTNQSTLARWFSYENDPLQVASALGCVENVPSPSVLCEPDIASVASQHFDECK
jgi:hypothetical protein